MSFKYIIVIQDKKKAKKNVRLKENKGNWQLNIMCDPGLDPGLGEKCCRDIIGALDN